MTEDLDTAGQRLRWARQKAGYKSGEEAAAALGFKPVTYRTYENETSGFSRHASKFGKAFGVPVSWLLEGGPLPSQADDGAGEGVIAPLNSDIEYVKLFDISYAMGDGSLIEGSPEVSLLPFSLDFLRRYARGSTDMLFLAKGHGDSMEPTLRREDLLMIDTSQVTVTMQDEIWALTYAGAGMVKRLRRLPDDMVRILSDNTTVPDYDVDAAEVHIVGKVVWVARGL